MNQANPFGASAYKFVLINEQEAWLYTANKAVKLYSSDRHVMLLIDMLLAPPGFKSYTDWYIYMQKLEQTAA